MRNETDIHRELKRGTHHKLGDSLKDSWKRKLPWVRDFFFKWGLKGVQAEEFVSWRHCPSKLPRAHLLLVLRNSACHMHFWIRDILSSFSSCLFIYFEAWLWSWNENKVVMCFTQYLTLASFINGFGSGGGCTSTCRSERSPMSMPSYHERINLSDKMDSLSPMCASGPLSTPHHQLCAWKLTCLDFI